jgi:hypothetical protein
MAESEPTEPNIPAGSAETAPAKAADQRLKYEPVKVVLWIGLPFGILLGLGAIKLMTSMPRVMVPVIVGAYALAVGVFILRKLKRAFIDAQSRTIEWLAAIGFAGTLMTVGKVALFDLPDRGSDGFYLIIAVAIISISWSFGGAAWGWHIAKRLNEQDGRRRMWFICAAWLAVVGIVGLMACAAILIVLALNLYLYLHREYPSEFGYYGLMLLGSMAVSSLAIPAWRLDRRAPILASQKSVGSAWKPTVIDTYETCEFGPRPLKFVNVLLNLTGFNLVLLPLLVRKLLSNPQPVAIQEKRFDDLPATVREFFNEYHEDIRGLGFQHRYYLQTSGSTKNVVAFSSVFLNRDAGQSASLSASYVLTHQGAQLHRASLDYTNAFADETLLITNNANDLSFPIVHANRNTMSFPEIRDVTLLHRVHCARLKKFNRADLPGVIKDSNYEISEVTRTIQKLIDSEYAAIRTLKGTILGTWSIVWPASLVRIYRRRQRARAELAALGFEPAR